MITVLGLPLVIGNMNRIAAEIETVAEPEGMEQAAERIRAAWVTNIESEGLVDTGHYHDSISVSREGDEIAVYSAVEYARFLEFGTSHIPAYPVAERAFDEHQEQAIDDVGDAIRRVVR